MPIEQSFFGLPVATLNTLLTQATDALTGILTTGQSYSIANRSFSHANMAELRKLIQELQAAITSANGTRVTRTYADFR